MDMKIPLLFLGRLSSPLLHYIPASLPPTDHHTALHATVRSYRRDNEFEVLSRTIHWRYNLKTQFMITVYCHVLVAEGGRETFARLLKGRHLSDTRFHICWSHCSGSYCSKSTSAASSKAQTGKCYGVCNVK